MQSWNGLYLIILFFCKTQTNWDLELKPSVTIHNYCLRKKREKVCTNCYSTLGLELINHPSYTEYTQSWAVCHHPIFCWKKTAK